MKAHVRALLAEIPSEPAIEFAVRTAIDAIVAREPEYDLSKLTQWDRLQADMDKIFRPLREWYRDGG